MKNKDITPTFSEDLKNEPESGAQITNEDVQEPKADDEVMVFKLNLEELLQTVEETQAEGDILKDLIENFVESLSSDNSDNLSEAIRIITETHPEHSKILTDVKEIFELHKQKSSQPNNDEDDFCKIKDSKLYQIKIQVEDLLDNWMNDPDGCKQAVDILMDDEKELRQVLSRMGTKIDTNDSGRVEALASLNLYVQEKRQEPIKMRLRQESQMMDSGLLVEFKVEMEKILEVWSLNPNHAKRATDGLMQRNSEIFREALLQVGDEKQDGVLQSLGDLKSYIEAKKQNPKQAEPEKESDDSENEDAPTVKKGFFSGLFGGN
jgi:hypothetical protein